MKQIKIIVITLTILQVLSLSGNSSKQQVNADKIPKILWTYWDSGYEGAHLFTKLCINNMEYYSKFTSWQFRFLTKQNLTNYISKQSQQRAKTMISTSKNYILLQNHVDIYRLFLLYQNGGMWLDTNSFFVDSLSWIDNIQNETSPYNRLRNDPDIITFTYNDLYGGNKTRVIDSETEQEVYLFPGIEIWSFITKPYSKFLHDVIENLEYSLLTPRNQLNQENKNKGYLYALENQTYFMTSNYQFQTVLQKKQKQIEKNKGKFDQKYAVDYYRIWSIDSLSTAFALFQVNQWTVGTVMQSLFHDSIDSFSTKYNSKKYFIKFTGDFYPYINSFLPHVQLLTCLKTINKIQTNSTIYKFLLQPSASMPIVKSIKDSQSNNLTENIECKLFSSQNFQNMVLKLVILVFGIFLANYMIFHLIKGANWEQKKSFTKISSNDI